MIAFNSIRCRLLGRKFVNASIDKIVVSNMGKLKNFSSLFFRHM